MTRLRVVARVARGRADVGPRVPGIVLEVSGRSAVVMAEGRFLRVPAMPGWESGEEIWVSPPQTGQWAFRLRRRIGAVVVGCVAVASGGALWAGVASAQVVAVVSVDINPSLDLSVDAHGRVLHVTPMDPEAQELVDQGALTGLPLQQAVALVVNRAVGAGYLTAAQATGSNPVVLVAAAPAHRGEPSLPAPVADAVSQTQAQVQTVLQQKHVDATVAVAQAPQSDIKPAKAARLSVGKYELYQDLKAAGAKTEPEQWRSQTVDEALTGAGVPRKDVPAVVAAVAKRGEVSEVLRDAEHGESAAAVDHILRSGGAASVSGAGSSSSSRGDGHGPPADRHEDGSSSSSSVAGAGASSASSSSSSSGGTQVPSSDRHSDGGRASSSDGQSALPPGHRDADRSTSATPSQTPSDAPQAHAPSAAQPGLLQRIEQELFGSHARRGRQGDNGNDGPGSPAGRDEPSGGRGGSTTAGQQTRGHSGQND